MPEQTGITSTAHLEWSDHFVYKKQSLGNSVVRSDILASPHLSDNLFDHGPYVYGEAYVFEQFLCRLWNVRPELSQ